jgi:hypothetical protein
MRRKRKELSTINRANVAVSVSLSRVVDRFIQLAVGVQSFSTYGRRGEIQRMNQSRSIEDNA